jgi:HlyD family secretion protein
MKKVFKLLIILGVLGGGAVGVYAWLQSRDSGAGGLKSVEVTLGSVTEKAVAVGQIQPRMEFAVKSKISGIVKTAFVDVGQAVRAGDPLFDILPDPTPSERVEAEGRVEKARSSFNLAEADYNRATELHRQAILSRELLDSKKEAYERSKIELDRAQDGLDLLRKGRLSNGSSESIIRAPAAGVVLSRKVNPGDPVVPLTSYQEGTPLATIADMSDLIFKGTVDEIDVGKLAIGLPTRIKIGAIPDSQVTGKLTRIAPKATEKEGARLFDVEIELDPASAVTLRAGYSANADLVLQEHKDVLVIPERLVTFEDAGKKAFVELPAASPKGEPRKIEIKTGLSDGLNVEVVSGLKKGDRIIERPPKEITG